MQPDPRAKMSHGVRVQLLAFRLLKISTQRRMTHARASEPTTPNLSTATSLWLAREQEMCESEAHPWESFQCARVITPNTDLSQAVRSVFRFMAALEKVMIPRTQMLSGVVCLVDERWRVGTGATKHSGQQITICMDNLGTISGSS